MTTVTRAPATRTLPTHRPPPLSHHRGCSKTTPLAIDPASPPPATPFSLQPGPFLTIQVARLASARFLVLSLRLLTQPPASRVSLRVPRALPWIGDHRSRRHDLSDEWRYDQIHVCRALGPRPPLSPYWLNRRRRETRAVLNWVDHAREHHI